MGRNAPIERDAFSEAAAREWQTIAARRAEHIERLQAAIDKAKVALIDMLSSAQAVIADDDTDDDYEVRYWLDSMKLCRAALVAVEALTQEGEGS